MRTCILSNLSYMCACLSQLSLVPDCCRKMFNYLNNTKELFDRSYFLIHFLYVLINNLYVYIIVYKNLNEWLSFVNIFLENLKYKLLQYLDQWRSVNFLIYCFPKKNSFW